VTNQQRLNLTDVINYHDFILALGTFLDGFKRSENKAELIACPPQAEGAEKLHLCMLAAVTHKLASDYGLPTPEWVYSPIYKMPQPYFAFDTKNKEYQAFLFEDTPPEYAQRNLFIGSNAFERV